MPRTRKYEVPTEDELDYAADWADRIENDDFTRTQRHFADWMVDKCQPEFKSARETEAFRQGALAGLVYRMHHQRSPENHAQRANGQVAREEEAEARAAERERKRQEREEAREAQAAEREEKAAQRAAKKAKSETVEPEEAPQPKRRGRPPEAAAVEPEVETPVKRRPGRPAKAATTAPAAAKPGRRPAATGARRPARRGGAEAEF
jgi:hypothetical protein